MAENAHRAAASALAAAALLAATSLGLKLVLPPRPVESVQPWIESDGAELGEGLLHGIPLDPDWRDEVGVPGDNVSRNMPLSSLWRAAIHHTPASVRNRWPEVVVFGQAAFLTGGACLAAGPLAAAAVIPLARLYGLAAPSYVQLEYSGYVVLVLLVACLMIWRARRPDPARAALLGLGIGISLLYRSVLAFLPPVLAGLEFLGRPKTSERSRSWPILLLLPYAPLVPWIVMNWRLFGRFVPFENGRAAGELVIGSLGLITTTTGNWRGAFAGALPAAPTTGQALRWAARQIASHPGRYAGAVALRALAGAALHPLAFLLGGAGLWLRRRRAESRAVALLAAYFFGICCLIPIQENYLLPLWPLLGLLAASALPDTTGLLAVRRAFDDGARAIIAGLLAALAACAAAAAVLVLAYPGRAARPDAVAAELRRWPGDDWLLSLDGSRLLQAGDFRGAAGRFESASRLAPRSDEWRLNLAWAQALAGDRRPLAAFSFASDDHGLRAWLEPRLRLDRASVLLDRGDEKGARAELAAMKEDRSLVPDMFEVRTRRDRWAVEKLRDARDWTADLATQLPQAPPSKRAALSRLLDELGREDQAGGSAGDEPPAEPMSAEPLALSAQLELAELAMSAGSPSAARPALRLAARLHPAALPAVDRRRAALLFRRAGLLDESLALARSLEGTGGPSGFWLELAGAALDAGRRAEAMELAQEGSRDAGSLEEDLQQADLWTRLGRPERALSLLDALASKRPNEPSLRLEQAKAQLAAGRAAKARAVLASVRASACDDEQLHDLAMLDQDAGRAAEAAQILSRLARKDPSPTRLEDLAVAEFLSGRIAEAEAHARKSLALAPDRLSAYLTLGAVLCADGRPAQAHAAYEAGLKAGTGSPDNAALRPRLQDAESGLTAAACPPRRK